MKIKYCLPIIKTTKQEVLTMIQQQSEYDYFEVWLDYITDLDESFLKNLVDVLGNKLIVLLRRKNLEPMKINFKERLVILSILKNLHIFIDLDIVVNKKELDYLKLNKNSFATLISYHNYKQTPPDRSLRALVTKMKSYHPAIIKIASFCKTPSDALRLLELQQRLKPQRHIVLGMGEFGTITRVFGTLWGNEMIFAPAEETEHSAPGQLTKTALEKIFDALGKGP